MASKHHRQALISQFIFIHEQFGCYEFCQKKNLNSNTYSKFISTKLNNDKTDNKNKQVVLR